MYIKLYIYVCKFYLSIYLQQFFMSKVYSNFHEIYIRLEILFVKLFVYFNSYTIKNFALQNYTEGNGATCLSILPK